MEGNPYKSPATKPTEPEPDESGNPWPTTWQGWLLAVAGVLAFAAGVVISMVLYLTAKA
jgi:hypothetical protein